MADDESGKGGKDVAKCGKEGKRGGDGAPSQAETSTSAGIDDPVVRAALQAEKAKIAAAQAKIAAMTGGRTSRTGSVAESRLSKGEAHISVTQTVKKTISARGSPTTFLDPVSGEMRVMPTPAPQFGGSGLLDSLPSGPNLPAWTGGQGVPEVVTLSDDTESAAAGPSGTAGKTRVDQAGTETGRKEKSGGGEKKKGAGAKEAGGKEETAGEKANIIVKPAGDMKPGTEYTKVILKSLASGYHYQIFIAGEHDYEVGDTILIKTKAGKEMTSIIMELAPGSPGPLDATGVMKFMDDPGVTGDKKGKEAGEEAGDEGADDELREEQKKPRRSARAAAIAKAERRRKGLGDKESEASQDAPAAPPVPRKKQAPKQTHVAGELPGYSAVGEWAEGAHAELDKADKARGLDREPDEGMEPAGLRRIWEWDEDMVRRARELAHRVANMPQDESLTARGQLKIRELEALLHSKTGTKPKAIPPMGETEEQLESVGVTGKETDRELALIAARNSRIAAKAGLCNTRGIQTCLQKIDLQSHTLALALEQLESLRRIVTRYDRPEMRKEQMMANPDLNPYLAGYVPFDNQVSVDKFFESEERTYELQRWLLSKLTWEPSQFIPRLCDLICTREYRIKYSYPGKQLMHKLLYIPQRLATFLFGVAQTASLKFGGFNPEKAEEQLRVAFQASQVAKRPRLDAEGRPVKSKRKRRDESLFTTSEEEEGEDDEDEAARYAENYEHTLVDYESYLASDNDVAEVEATKNE